MSRKLRELREKYGTTERSANLMNRMDPTANKKYVEWLFKVRYIRANRLAKYRVAGDFPATKEEDVKRALAWFERNLNGKVPADFRDINKFKTVTEFLNKINEISTPSRKDIKNSVRVVLDNERFKILAPLTAESARMYGSGTRWCTTQKRYYENYTKSGVLYYIIDKGIDRKFGLVIGDNAGRNPNFNNLNFFNNEDNGVRLANIKMVYGNVFDVVINTIKTDFGVYLNAKLKKKALNDAISRINTTKREFSRNGISDDAIEELFNNALEAIMAKNANLNF
ncbi:MAG: hypothetical protein ACXADH_16835 [Candidatus Kariarchaeaceae archaeon]|jgi:hypothetical protein